MRTHLRSVAWLLPLFLTACFHKSHPAQNQPVAPPIQETAQPSPEPPPSDVPPPATTTPAQTAAETTPAVKEPEKPARHTVHHKKPVAKPVEQATNGSAGVSAIGQLSPGDSSELSRETVSSIEATERGLKQINRTLSTQELKTVAQIKEFLKQARSALASGDVDGAHTLAMKAKVLFGEINH